ncbi:MAG: allantoinase AllB [Ignavibacteriales bacterium]|nr:allantoinase AllB [Ignavibacteriales bacterium]MCF8316279.1 allantoinase AllB [Ignavibacteriales bacterium]MCF8437863.1 allantoinase AllB [Ignavibacteriales bacterium]
MEEKPGKILKNIFLSAGDNKLRPADIMFTEKFGQIVFRSENPVEWEEISTPEKRAAYVGTLEENYYLPEAHFYDGGFMVAIPGAIDSHVHFDTPGFEFRDDFEHGSTAAAFGGVTTVIDMPCTSLPPVTSADNFGIKLNALKGRSLVDYAFWGGVRGNDFCSNRDIGELVKELDSAGVSSFKVYLISGMDTFKDLYPEQLVEAAAQIKKTGKPMGVHAEDKALIFEKTEKFKNAGLKGWQDYCSARDVEAEVKAVATVIDAVRKTGCRAHIVHLSSGAGLELIRKAKSEGLPVSAETCPHYLYFTQKDFENQEISALLKTAPPVKHDADREALWQGLADGSIAFVVTDHAGCNPDAEKTDPDFWKIYGGIPGVEHRVPFLFSEGFLKGRIDLEQTIRLLSTNVAEYFNLNSKGSIREGLDADFALIDLWASQTITASAMHSKGKFTPFQGKQLNAVVIGTFLRGTMIIDQNRKQTGKTGYGQFIGISRKVEGNLNG